jgi:membrane-associated phospholipid phosphatase
VTVEVSQWVKRQPNPTNADPDTRANAFAAMPSDHFASAAITALVLTEQSPLLGAPGGSYALLGFARVYLGEHYIGDLMAGLALALAERRQRTTWVGR